MNKSDNFGFTAIVLLIVLSCFSDLIAEDKNQKSVVYSGKEADDKLNDFVKNVWGKQTWQIEYREIDGLENRSAWHVGNHWWVRLLTVNKEGGMDVVDLTKLDNKSIYRFEGVPVEQAYGTITFYMLGRLTKLDSK